MSNIYIQEPPTYGKVLLKTSLGEIDIELWSKETPKACRNFVQLCLEGYYDGTIFHRIVKGFIAQGGDPTGTGTGGESIYGHTFKDEFHSRLRFIRRGLVAMANAGKDDNGSQFFFTLGATPELQSKHTIFGKVTGETVYNMMKLDDALVDHDDRPQYPPKINSVEVLSNPFPDIVPRVLPKQKEKKTKKKEKQAGVKNFKLLSFGEEAEEDEEQVSSVNEKLSGRGKSTHDVLDDPSLSSVPAVETRKTGQESDSDALSGDQQSSDSEDSDGSENKQQVNLIKNKLKRRDGELLSKKDDKSDDEEEFSLAKEKREERKRKMEDIRKEIDDLKKTYREDKKKIKHDHEPSGKQSSSKPNTSAEDNPLVAAHEEEMKKFKSKANFPKKGASRESFTLDLLNKFRNKLHAAKEKSQEEGEEVEDNPSDEDDTSDKWLAHKLHFKSEDPVLARDANTKDDDWYEIHDPRSKINQQKREISKSLMKKKEKR